FFEFIRDLVSIRVMSQDPRPPLFPYATLFRSFKDHVLEAVVHEGARKQQAADADEGQHPLAGAERPKIHEEHLGSLDAQHRRAGDRKSTRLNSSHVAISYAVFCLKKKTVMERH